MRSQNKAGSTKLSTSRPRRPAPTSPAHHLDPGPQGLDRVLVGATRQRARPPLDTAPARRPATWARDIYCRVREGAGMTATRHRASGGSGTRSGSHQGRLSAFSVSAFQRFSVSAFSEQNRVGRSLRRPKRPCSSCFSLFTRTVFSG